MCVTGEFEGEATLEALKPDQYVCSGLMGDGPEKESQCNERYSISRISTLPAASLMGARGLTGAAIVSPLRCGTGEGRLNISYHLCVS